MAEWVQLITTALLQLQVQALAVNQRFLLVLQSLCEQLVEVQEHLDKLAITAEPRAQVFVKVFRIRIQVAMVAAME
jgi:hypothetical protein